MNDGALQCDRCCQQYITAVPTFDLLGPFVTDVLGDGYVVTDECTATSMLDRLLHRTGILETVDSKTSPLGKVAVFLLYRLDLDSVERDECCLSSALVSHVLDTVDGNFLMIDDNCVDVSTQDGANSEVVLLLSGFAEIDDASVNAGEHPLEVGDHLAKSDLALVLTFVRASCQEFAVHILELLVQFGLLDADD